MWQGLSCVIKGTSLPCILSLLVCHELFWFLPAALTQLGIVIVLASIWCCVLSPVCLGLRPRCPCTDPTGGR